MNCIVNVDAHWGIGNKGSLLVRIPNDMKMFRQETMGKVVVLGRKTLETFPGGRPLEGRYLALFHTCIFVIDYQTQITCCSSQQKVESVSSALEFGMAL